MEQFIARKEAQNTRKKAKECLFHYLGELRLHFNLEDKDIINILKNSYFELTRESLVKSWMCVIKSFLHHK